MIERNILRQTNTTKKINRVKARGPRTADAPISSLVSNFIRLISKSMFAVARSVAHEAIFETKRRWNNAMKEKKTIENMNAKENSSLVAKRSV